MTIADLISILDMPDFVEIQIYEEDNEEPSWEGMGNKIPEEYMEAEIDVIYTGSEGITIRI